MKTSVRLTNKCTCAQIKPTKTTAQLFYDFISYIRNSLLLTAIFFSTTSYVNEEFAMYDLKHEFYSHEMHLGIFNLLGIDTCSLYTDSSPLKVQKLVKEFYRKNGYNPVWTINQNLNNAAGQLLSVLNNAGHYGLDRKYYNYDKLISLYDTIQNTGRSDTRLILRQDFDLMLTDACFQFMIHLNAGIVSLDTILNDEVIRALSEFLYKGVRNDNLAEKLLSLQPQNISYRNLQRALEKFVINQAIDDVVTEIPDPARDSAGSYAAARLVLIRLGYLNRVEAIKDTAIHVAIQDFQKYHGLKPDGTLGKNTRKAMSMSTRERFLMAALTLDKLRKDVDFGNDYLFVNIPSYQLRIIHKNKIDKIFNVVVGKPSTPTPELTSKLETIVTAPEWNVPRSITVNEMLPLVKKDSSYLFRNNFRMIDRQLNEIDINSFPWQNMSYENFDNYFIQKSGRSNALGLLKFNFKNPYRVYLHDTPSKKYFNNDIRAYSHGCVRLQHPDQLALYLVENKMTGEQKPDIGELMKNNITKEIALSEPMDIYLRYLTCEADEDLNLYFYKDIYNRDCKLIHWLFN